jgi:hypothetical protein
MEGEYIVRLQKVILVSFNYRLGSLGYAYYHQYYIIIILLLYYDCAGKESRNYYLVTFRYCCYSCPQSFLGGKILANRTSDGSFGNFGLQDQRFALQWVQVLLQLF